MIEVLRAYEWIQTTLGGDATLAGLVSTRIYSEQAPQNATMPFVVYNLQGGQDLMSVGSIRVFSNALYQVKAVTSGRGFATAVQIADRIDELLHGANGSVDDGTVIASAREMPIVYGESDNGVEYRHTGGIYRLIVQEA